MRPWRNLNEIIEEQFEIQANGVLDKKWNSIFEMLDRIDNSFNLYERIKYDGPLTLKIVKDINMGESYSNNIYDFVSSEYLFEKNGDVYIKNGTEVEARVAHNNWVEVTFETQDFYDIAFDEVEDYDNHFELQSMEVVEID